MIQPFAQKGELYRPFVEISKLWVWNDIARNNGILKHSSYLHWNYDRRNLSCGLIKYHSFCTRPDRHFKKEIKEIRHICGLYVLPHGELRPLNVGREYLKWSFRILKTSSFLAVMKIWSTNVIFKFSDLDLQVNYQINYRLDLFQIAVK